MRPHDDEIILWWRDCIDFPRFWRKRDPRKDGPTDPGTDRPTDRRTDRDARTYLKRDSQKGTRKKGSYTKTRQHAQKCTRKDAHAHSLPHSSKIVPATYEKKSPGFPRPKYSSQDHKSPCLDKREKIVIRQKKNRLLCWENSILIKQRLPWKNCLSMAKRPPAMVGVAMGLM